MKSFLITELRTKVRHNTPCASESRRQTSFPVTTQSTSWKEAKDSRCPTCWATTFLQATLTRQHRSAKLTATMSKGPQSSWKVESTTCSQPSWCRRWHRISWTDPKEPKTEPWATSCRRDTCSQPAPRSRKSRKVSMMRWTPGSDPNDSQANWRIGTPRLIQPLKTAKHECANCQHVSYPPPRQNKHGMHVARQLGELKQVFGCECH